MIAAEAGAHEYRYGGWFCAAEPFTALRALMPAWMTRVNDIFKTLGSHNLLCTPNEAAFENPGARPAAAPLPPGAPTASAPRSGPRSSAWRGTSPVPRSVSRSELYERFYLASQPRNLTGNHLLAQRRRASGPTSTTSAASPESSDVTRTRRDEILAIAALQFAERGVASTTVRDIGAAAGILSGSLYHHFESKEQMVAELLLPVMQRQVDHYRQVVAGNASVAVALRSLIKVAVAEAAQTPDRDTDDPQ